MLDVNDFKESLKEVKSLKIRVMMGQLLNNHR